MQDQQRQDFWQQQITLCQQSGLSAAAFCKQHELAYHQFGYWRRKLKQNHDQKKIPTEPLVGFARVMSTSSPASSSGELAITLPSGIQITGLHTGNLELFFAILRQVS